MEANLTIPVTEDEILDANALAAERAQDLPFPDWLLVYDEARYQELPKMTIHEAVIALYRDMHNAYGKPDCGATRATFIDKKNDVVYKIPRPFGIGDDGDDAAYHGDGDEAIVDVYLERIEASYQEARDCESGDYDWFPIAACRALDNQYGIPVLAMEYVDVEDCGDYDSLPKWIMHVDSGQAGTTTSGHFVAYDWGNA